MAVRLDRSRMIVVARAVVGLLAGCDGGGGDGGVLQAHFAIGGQGSCGSVTVEVDLDEADAVIDRDAFGDVACLLDAALEQQGCDIDFSESQGVLTAVISGCTVPSAAELFVCGFDEADLTLLQDTAFSQCQCLVLGCDDTPSVCVSDGSTFSDCEVLHCDNGLDDDGDGLVDCEDTSCEGSPACVATTTSSMTTPSNSSPTTIPPTTFPPTTLPVESCRVVFRLADEVTVGSLQWSTGYSGTGGSFLGEGGSVECASLIEGALAAFNDQDDMHSLESGVVRVGGFTGPANVAECSFVTAVAPVPVEFGITNIEAATPDLVLIEPAPNVIVSSIDCGGSPGTTTTTQEGATTTTMGGPTTTTIPTTTTTTTTTTLPATAYTVLLHLDSASDSVGALQVAVDYSDAPGGFLGTGAGAACTTELTDGLFAKNDHDASRRLVLGLISLSTFQAPIALASCEFRGSEVPTPDDFQVTIEDSTNGSGDPVTVTVGLAVVPAP